MRAGPSMSRKSSVHGALAHAASSSFPSSVGATAAREHAYSRGANCGVRGVGGPLGGVKVGVGAIGGEGADVGGAT